MANGRRRIVIEDPDVKILIVTGFFPPYAPMSGVRANKLAKFLHDRGHDIRVLAAKDLPHARTLSPEIPPDRVIYTRWADVNGLPKLVQNIHQRSLHNSGSQPQPQEDGGASTAETPPPGLLKRALRRIGSIYATVLNWPDPLVGWAPYAVMAGRRLLNRWRPDLIYATSPPPTSLIVARRIARYGRIPWVAEFRDLWADDAYDPPPGWRRVLEARQERNVLGTAAGIVTVSEPWVAHLRGKFNKPTALVLNGFDAHDFPEDVKISPSSGGLLRIVYTGSIYRGYRDPTPLFEAMKLLDDEGERVRVDMYGAVHGDVRAMAERCGVVRCVGIHGPVSYEESVKLQRSADILLMLQWNDAREAGTISGKLFEYIGARRPILGIGFEGGAAAAIIKQRGVGIMANDGDTIAKQLRLWLEEKSARGKISPPPPEARAGLSRGEQFAKLEDFLAGVLASRSEDESTSG